MSWSVSAVGKPAAVKAALASQFEGAKSYTKRVPHEFESVIAIEKIVNSQLDYLADVPKMAVKVEASGSAYKNVQKQGDVEVIVSGSSSVSLRVDPIHGWVE